MDKHSPEPLHDGSDHEVYTTGLLPLHYIYVNASPVAAASTIEMQQRLIACYNACRGLNPEVVPELVETVEALVSPYKSLDEHLAAFQKARELVARVKG